MGNIWARFLPEYVKGKKGFFWKIYFHFVETPNILTPEIKRKGKLFY